MRNVIKRQDYYTMMEDELKKQCMDILNTLVYGNDLAESGTEV